jgi:hypothetical protein
VIPFALEGVHHVLVAAILSAEFGIAVRNGTFCAQPYLRRLLGLTAADVEQARADLHVGDRSRMPGLVRASFGMYNTTEDVDALADALAVISSGAYRGEYVQDRASGDFRPLGWAPDLAATSACAPTSVTPRRANFVPDMRLTAHPAICSAACYNPRYQLRGWGLGRRHALRDPNLDKWQLRSWPPPAKG